jgi:hypothetical protein
MFSKILLALGVVLAISALPLGKEIYKFSVIKSQCLIMFLASNMHDMQLSEKMWEAISFKFTSPSAFHRF